MVPELLTGKVCNLLIREFESNLALKTYYRIWGTKLIIEYGKKFRSDFCQMDT